MKKHLLLLLISSSILFSCTPPNKNIISGDIKGLEKGDKVFLAVGSIADTPVVVDSVVVESDGRFYMETSATDTDTRLFFMKKGAKLDLNGSYANFFMEGFSTMNISGDINYLCSVKPTGGLYDMPEMQESNLINIMRSIYSEKYRIYNALKDSNANQDTLKKAEVEHDEAAKRYADNYERRVYLDSCFRENNPDMAYSACLLRFDYNAMERGIEYYDSLYNKLTLRVKATLEGKSLGDYIAKLKATAVGSMAPNFKTKDISGNDISLSDFKGKYVFLEFWGTWCSPCVKAMPDVVAMYEKVKGDNFEVISIACREGSESSLVKFIADNKMTWRNINGTKGEIEKMYGIAGYPSSFLIDPTGKIIEAGHPYDVIPKIEGIVLKN